MTDPKTVGASGGVVAGALLVLGGILVANLVVCTHGIPDACLVATRPYATLGVIMVVAGALLLFFSGSLLLLLQVQPFPRFRPEPRTGRPCPNCGRLNRVDAVSCIACGDWLPERTSDSASG